MQPSLSPVADYRASDNGKSPKRDIDEEAPLAASAVVSNKLFQVSIFMVLMELAERTAYFTMWTNITTYIQQQLNYDASTASMFSGAFNSFVFLTPLFGAYIADSKWGRFRTICVFSVIYIIGFILLFISTFPSIANSSLFFFALYGLLCVGFGGLKCNVTALGADQYDPVVESEGMKKYFNFYYWGSNVGVLLAVTVIAEVAARGTYGFSIVLASVTVFIGLAVLVFFSQRHRYVQMPPAGSSLSTFSSIFYQGARRSSSYRGLAVLGFVGMIFTGLIMNTVLVFVPQTVVTDTLSYVVGGMILSGVFGIILFGQNIEWIEAAGPHFSEEKMIGARQLLRLLPYAGFMVSFWMVYMLMSGPWTNQGCQMDCRVFSEIQRNPSTWCIWNVIIILVGIPVMNKFVYPVVGKIIGRPEAGPSPLQKIGCGFLFTITAVIISGIVEIERKRAPIVEGLVSVCSSAEDTRPVSSMTLWVQIPQFAFLATGEILAAVAATDFFYNQVPDDAKSACQGINLLTVSLGSAVCTWMQKIFTSLGYLPTDLNTGSQELFFFTQACLGCVFLCLFVYVSQSFEYTAISSKALSEEPTPFEAITCEKQTLKK